jgi:hypothetical protein
VCAGEEAGLAGEGVGSGQRLLPEPPVDSDLSDLIFMTVVDTVAAADHGQDESRSVSAVDLSSPPLILFYFVDVCAQFAPFSLFMVRQQHKISN